MKNRKIKKIVYMNACFYPITFTKQLKDFNI